MPVFGFWDLLIIALILLLVFGPKRLPKLGRSLGTGVRELGNAAKGFRDEIRDKHERELPAPAAREAPRAPSPTNTPAARERDSIT